MYPIVHVVLLVDRLSESCESYTISPRKRLPTVWECLAVLYLSGSVESWYIVGGHVIGAHLW